MPEEQSLPGVSGDKFNGSHGCRDGADEAVIGHNHMHRAAGAADSASERTSR